MGVQWVVKLSKLCNLRCRYCYEWPWLGNPARMDLADLDTFFRHIAEFYARAPQKMDFVWHGGEPLLHENTYYEQIFASQRLHFDPVGIPFKNSIQTNLFLLRPDTIAFLRDNFENIGVSVDLFGEQRLDASGKQSQKKVLENMQKLLDEGVGFGCITVLSRLTAPYVKEIFQFYQDLGISFRLLPIYRTGYAHQQDQLGLRDTEIVEALKCVTDLWFEMDGLLQIRPIQDYVSNVLRKYSLAQLGMNLYSKRNGELLFIVDTDGGVYSNADAYSSTLSYGNIFQMGLADLLRSSAHERAMEESENRMRLTCSECYLHGACSGFFMGEATPEQRYVDDRGALKCGVAFPLQVYIEQKLRERGILDLSSRSINRDRLPLLKDTNLGSEALEF